MYRVPYSLPPPRVTRRCVLCECSIAVGSTIGVARNPRLTLISYKVMDGLGYGTFESVVEGLDYAANRAKDNKRRVGLQLKPAPIALSRSSMLYICSTAESVLVHRCRCSISEVEAAAASGRVDL